MTIFFFLLAAILFFFVHRDGFRRGYVAGKIKTDRWWLGIESSAENAQRELWREELKR